MLMQTDSAQTSKPLVWVLQTARAGDSAQARALADATGWRSELKTLQFNTLFHVPNRLLGASLISLTSAAKATLQPPWPDLVIGVARRTVPVARWIREQTNGRAKLVQIGRPRLDPDYFDLVISTPQYGVHPRPNVLSLPVPIHPSISVSDEDRDYWQGEFSALPRPWTGVILGGAPWPFKFDAAALHALAKKINALTNGGGSCLICSSPRTPPRAAEDLAAQLDCPSFAAGWSKQAPNPYRAVLNLSDQLVVCGDSASMLGEACSTGKPVFIYDLPDRAFSGTTAQIGHALSKTHLISPPRTMRKLHTGLVESGHAQLLGAPGNCEPRQLPNQLEIAGDRVASLFKVK